MKTASILMCAISIATTMQAQSNIIGIREANGSDGKILTMEETILSKDLSPKDLHCRWVDDEHIAMFKDGKWLKYNIETEDTSSYRPERPRPFAYSKDRSLYLLDKDSVSRAIMLSESKDISFGQSVSRNEFGINGGVFMSPDNSKVAFYRKDESHPSLFLTLRQGQAPLKR